MNVGVIREALALFECGAPVKVVARPGADAEPVNVTGIRAEFDPATPGRYAVVFVLDPSPPATEGPPDARRAPR